VPLPQELPLQLSSSHLHGYEKTNIMSMLFSKIKFEIDINNDELLRTMSEQTYKRRKEKKVRSERRLDINKS
jgi:hypothetical protein